MKRPILHLLVLVMCICMLSCEKQSPSQDQPAEIPKEVLLSIQKLGFSTKGVIKRDGGYLVEGDILLTNENLKQAQSGAALRIAETEQYRTTHIVQHLPRTITIGVSNLPAVYLDAIDEAIKRYNAEQLRIKFQRVSTNIFFSPNITIVGFSEGFHDGYIILGSAGFPYPPLMGELSGEPYHEIKLNTHPDAYGLNPNINYLASVIAHEMGHCIGFRHTDYMDRSFSCGGSPFDEGASFEGAVHIPGTPASPNAGSWMLACSDGSPRFFNSNDRIALQYLY